MRGLYHGGGHHGRRPCAGGRPEHGAGRNDHGCHRQRDGLHRAATERFLDNAVMAKLEKVTIIHGKGTGALRAAVQQSLRRNKAVKSYRLGRYGEGESGVTVVELK